MESLGLKIRKALSRLNQIDNYLYTKPEREWNYDDLSLVKSFLRTARVEEYNTMEDLKKVKQFFSKPLEEVSAEYSRKNKRPVKVGDIVGNTVQGFDFKVLGIQDDKMKVMNIVTGKEFTTDIDNMRLSSVDEVSSTNEALSDPDITPFRLQNYLIDLNMELSYYLQKGEAADLRYAEMLKQDIADVRAELDRRIEAMTADEIEKDKNQFRREQGLEEGGKRGYLEATKNLNKFLQNQLDDMGVEYEMDPKNLSRPFTAIYKPENKSEEFNAKFEDFINKANLKDFVKIGVKEITDPRIDNPKFGAAPKEFASLRVKLGDESLLDKIQMINVNVLRDLLDELDSYNLEESSTYNEYSEVGYKKVGEEMMSLDDQAKAYFLEKLKKGEIDSLPDNPIAAFLNQMMKGEIDAATFGKYSTKRVDPYDDQVSLKNAMLGLEEGMGGQLDEKYFIEVSVRDARKAIDIFNDQYSKADIEMYGSNVYASNTISDIYDLYYDLTSQNIEILDYDIERKWWSRRSY